MLLLSFDNYEAPAKRLAEALNIEFDKIHSHRFPDGESLIKLPTNLPSKVIICQTLDFPNEKLVDLFIAAKSARDNGVEEIILVAPYLCYMRQDKAFEPGQAVSQRIIGPFLAQVFDHIVTVDPHLHRISSLEEAIPTQSAVALTAAHDLGEYVKGRYSNAVFVGPDEESRQWVSVVAKPANADYVVATKERYGDKSVKVTLPEYSWENKTAVLVDDVISSGHTMAEAASALKAKGCQKIIALCTHALLAPGAEELLKNNHIDEIISTDSIPHSSNHINLNTTLANAVRQLGVV